MADKSDTSDRLPAKAEDEEEPELGVLTLGCEAAHAAFENAGLVPSRVSTWDMALRRIHEPSVRALVFSSEGDAKEASRRVSRARQEAPLTEVFVWAPDGTGEDVRRALQQGAADVVLSRSPKPLARAVRRAIDRQRFLPRMQRFKLARSRSSKFEGMISRSPRMWELFETVIQIAPSGASVLVLGETGTGKELLARAIHKHSGRTGKFVAVNCGGIPEGLVDSELFGHEEGTFTGATRSAPGLFRTADAGTLFLDEVGNLPLSSQYSFLRALQEGAVRPVGGQHEIPVDVRVVAATSVSLDEEAQQGFFREDLLFRLDVVRLVVPTLRERPEDVLHLFGAFRRKLTRQYRLEAPEPSEGFLEALLAHDWPGNVRELENLTERLVLTHHGRRLTRRQFEQLKRPYRARPQGRTDPQPEPAPGGAVRRPTRASLPESPAPEAPGEIDLTRSLAATIDPAVDELERRYLTAALRANKGRVADTAATADISPRTLLRKLRKHGLDKRDFKPSG